MQRISAVVISIWVAISSPIRADELSNSIAALTDTPDYKHSRWGMLFVDASEGRVVVARNADQFFLPASTTKLYSCASALQYLGAAHKFETPLCLRGRIEKNEAIGDLILIASGDLTLGGRTQPDGTMAFINKDHSYADETSPDAGVTATDPLAGLRDLAKQVKARGIERVTGEVLIDDRLFDMSVGSGSGPRLVSPVIVNDNVVDVIVSPGSAAGQMALCSIRPESQALLIDHQVRTVPEGGPLKITVSGAAPGAIIVRGTIPEKSKPVLRILPVTDPSALARTLMIECLRREGVEVTASPFTRPTAELPPREGCRDLTVLGTHTSLPLSEAIKVTLKVSQNLYASTLPMLVAVRHDERTLAAGLRRQGMFLRLLGVDASAFSFAGGAGGANADATTPRATVQLLTALMKRPNWSVIDAGLPVLGVDGTLAGMISKESPVYGKVRAKTGTLWWDDFANQRAILRSKALAGTMTTAKGKTLVFALFVNDVPLPAGVLPSREGMLLGKICEVVYLHD